MLNHLDPKPKRKPRTFEGFSFSGEFVAALVFIVVFTALFTGFITYVGPLLPGVG